MPSLCPVFLDLKAWMGSQQEFNEVLLLGRLAAVVGALPNSGDSNNNGGGSFDFRGLYLPLTRCTCTQPSRAGSWLLQHCMRNCLRAVFSQEGTSPTRGSIINGLPCFWKLCAV